MSQEAEDEVRTGGRGPQGRMGRRGQAGSREERMKGDTGPCARRFL